MVNLGFAFCLRYFPHSLGIFVIKAKRRLCQKVAVKNNILTHKKFIYTRFLPLTIPFKGV